MSPFYFTLSNFVRIDEKYRTKLLKYIVRHFNILLEVKKMIYLSATELKNNLGHYMELSDKEDIYVTKNKKVITVLTSPSSKALQDFLDFPNTVGKIDEEIDYDEIIKEEVLKRCGY